MPNKLKKVYELEGLVCDLHAHFTAGSGSSMGISKSKATELLSSTIFDYEPNSRYVWTKRLLCLDKMGVKGGGVTSGIKDAALTELTPPLSPLKK